MPRHVSIPTLTAALLSGALVLGLAGCSRDQSTPTLLAEAKQYQEKGDLKAALIQLKNAVAKSPDDANARLQLGTLYLETGDAVSADKELRRAASLGTNPEQVLPLLARALQQQGKFKESLEELKPETVAKSAPLLALRGDALLATQQPDAAKEAYQAALALAPNNGAALTGMARHAMLAGSREEAELYAIAATEKDAGNPDVWNFRGAMLRASNKPDEALAAYDKVIALRPNDVNARIEQAYLHINQGKYDLAKADIDAARKAAPNSLLATYAQALLDYSQGKHAQARDALQKVLKAAPEHMPSILLAGAVELNLGSLQQSEQHLRKYLDNDPNNVYARKLLAQTLLKSAQPRDAVAVLAPTLEKGNADAQLLALAGESYMQAREFGKATGYLEQAAKLAPEAAVVRTSLGLARLNQGQPGPAIADLQRATELDPKSPAALSALVEAETGLKHYDKALDAASRLQALQPDSPAPLNMIATVHLAKGDQNAARAALEKAVAMQPTYFPAVTQLVRLDLAANKPEDAKKRFEALLEKDKKNFGAMVGLAELAMLQNRPEEATRLLEKAQAENPDAVAAAIKLGGHYLNTKQEQKALTLARNQLTQHPTNPDVLDLLGQAQLANKDAGGALDTYTKLINVLPKSALAQMRLAQTQALLKNDSAAAEALKRAVALQPDLLQARIAQIELAIRRGRTDEALTLAREVQKEKPDAPTGFLLEGDLHLAMKKPNEALAAYDKAFAIQPTPGLVVRSAGVLRQQGKHAEAQARVANWLKKHPDDPQALMFQAEMHLAAKQFKPAVGILEQIVKRHPNNVPALNNLAWAQQQENDPRALATAEQAYKLAANSPAVMDTLGWLLVEQGNVERGVPLLQKAAAAAPTALDIRYHLAVGLSKAGNKQGARKELEALLAQNKPFAQIEDARSLLKTL
ncbi:XrtA/PEP-CTERM system TPR-repeat protein PrsT [Massilia sp. YIM B02443]|uniref:XrtA/PEP-CTERM system TPR-repeat protein PrsT n=1 Tax=Massilia sp. YIM B02443 TaxID=3050127 RepID=UPI0025B6BF20|nr:XrtA/PEP-CTERM system TPR-repeat protein PrsT [Massilia sp. YIM B02443]MDN4038016.1 PEP-CTERM system TPR-repeat protein PrsT [Massilia sp. YIM B02443]